MSKNKKTLPKLFKYRVSKNPKLKAIGQVKKGSVSYISYEEYSTTIEQLSLSLIKHDMMKGSKVSILSLTRKEWNYFDLAIMLAGGITIPIYPSYLPSEIEYIFKHSESEILIIEDKSQLSKIIQVQKNLPNLRVIVSIERINENERNGLNANISFYNYKEFLQLGKQEKELYPERFQNYMDDVVGEDIASIIYTSGTTGEPKGAVITQHAFSSMLYNLRITLKGSISNEDKNLVFLPLSHVFGRVDSLLFLPLGIITTYAECIEKILDNLTIVRPTFILAVPRIFEKVYAKVMDQIESGSTLKQKIFQNALSVSNNYFEKIESDVSPTPLEIAAREVAYNVVFKKIYNKFGGEIRFFASGGAPLSVDIIKFLRNCNLTVLEGYGLTETIAPCSLNLVGKQIPGTVGVPMGDVQFKFASDGEILIKTEALFSGYYKNEVETKKAIDEDGWFHSGDIGEFTSEGYLKITDRKKDIIITSGGKNVAPQKIENMMKLQKYISHFMVIGDKRKYLTGIVGIEKEVFADRLDEFGLNQHSTIEDYAKNSHIQQLIQSNIDLVNSSLPSFETIKSFYIAPSEFSVEGGQLTPSLKLKKKVLLKEYESEINAMYP
ncbi:MAG: long-chain fatty acid--CoA ligase [Halobacteriovoraceae bacterium]|nr:long-chain fatty acid--CoA ligase [Halobacteriovoraceae bacterium]